jgi:hypothetical protein
MAALVAALALAGCASDGLNARGTTSAHGSVLPAPGTSHSGGVIYVDVDANSYYALAVMGLVAAGMYDDYLSWNYGFPGRKPPQLAGDRAIVERDCSVPMEATSANLRCK